MKQGKHHVMGKKNWPYRWKGGGDAKSVIIYPLSFLTFLSFWYLQKKKLFEFIFTYTHSNRNFNCPIFQIFILNLLYLHLTTYIIHLFKALDLSWIIQAFHYFFLLSLILFSWMSCDLCPLRWRDRQTTRDVRLLLGHLYCRCKSVSWSSVR